MYIRDEVRERWTSAGVFDRKNAQVDSFMQYMQDNPSECWDEYVEVFRRSYYELFDKLVLPLVKSRDLVLRAALVAKADLERPQEIDALKAMIRYADAERDQPVLLAIARRGNKALLAEMKKQSKLTAEILDQLSPRTVPVRPVTNVRGHRIRTPVR